jgi:hypothetical protein
MNPTASQPKVGEYHPRLFSVADCLILSKRKRNFITKKESWLLIATGGRFFGRKGTSSCFLCCYVRDDDKNEILLPFFFFTSLSLFFVLTGWNLIYWSFYLNSRVCGCHKFNHTHTHMGDDRWNKFYWLRHNEEDETKNNKMKRNELIMRGLFLIWFFSR